MTPQEKAKELVENFEGFTFGYDKETDEIKKEAKQCAQIVVDEVIDNILGFDPALNYWQQVKEEIEKL